MNEFKLTACIARAIINISFALDLINSMPMIDNLTIIRDKNDLFEIRTNEACFIYVYIPISIWDEFYSEYFVHFPYATWISS